MTIRYEFQQTTRRTYATPEVLRVIRQLTALCIRHLPTFRVMNNGHIRLHIDDREWCPLDYVAGGCANRRRGLTDDTCEIIMNCADTPLAKCPNGNPEMIRRTKEVRPLLIAACRIARDEPPKEAHTFWCA